MRRAIVVLAGVALVAATLAVGPVAGAATVAHRTASPPARSPGVSSPASVPAAGTISTFARNLANPVDIVAGPDGNLWFVNASTASIGRMTPTGTVTIFTGSNLSDPTGLVLGPDGNLWFTDGGDNAIGRVNVTTGAISLFTGANIEDPRNLIPGPDGRLWFSSNERNSISRITTTGTVTEYPAIPAGVLSAGPDGNVWVARTGSITKLTTAGVVKGTFTDASIDEPGPLVTGSDGKLWFVNSPIHGGFSIGTVTLTGTVSSFTDPSIVQPIDLVSGPDGALWYINLGNPATIGTITTAGVVSSYADPSFSEPLNLIVGPDANLWFTDIQNNSIDTITTAGVVTIHNDSIVAGPSSLVSGPGGELWFTNRSSIGFITTGGFTSGYLGNEVFDPNGIATGNDGNIWFTNGANANGAPNASPQVSVARMTPSGSLTIFADLALSDPGPIVAGPDGNLWFVDRGHDQLDSITTAGVITEVASLSGTPSALAVGPDGALWVPIASSTTIDRVTTAGTVTPFSDPQIDDPTAIAAGPDGALWFTCTNGTTSSIGRITPGGSVTSFTDSSIVGSGGITTGPDGALWFTNSNSSIGRITTSGTISHFTDSAAVVPTAIAAGSDGNLWFTDGPGAASPIDEPAAQANVIGRITPAGVISNFTGESGAPGAIAPGPTGTMWFPNPNANSISSVSTGTVGDSFHALAPTRILDSRPGGGNIGGYSTPWGAGMTRDVAVTGGSSGVPSSADAVVLNVTATSASSSSYLSLYPSGATPPTVSDLNFSAGETIANQVTVKVGANDKVSIFNNGGQVNVIADVTGYYSSATGDGFTSLTPTRILDSRPGAGNTGAYASPWGPNVSRDVAVGGHGGVPTNADAVVLNVTATDTDAPSYLSVWPQGSSRPTVSSINWTPGETIPNAVTVKLNQANGEVSVYNLTGDADVIVDVAGYFLPGTGDLFHPLTPARILDSRSATNYGAYTTPWTANATRTVNVAPLAGVLASADAVVANVTVTNTTGGSFLSVWPQGASRPLVSSLNWTPGETIPNAVTVKLGAGQVSMFNFSGNVDVITDVAGWYG